MLAGDREPRDPHSVHGTTSVGMRASSCLLGTCMGPDVADKFLVGCDVEIELNPHLLSKRSLKYYLCFGRRNADLEQEKGISLEAGEPAREAFRKAVETLRRLDVRIEERRFHALEILHGVVRLGEENRYGLRLRAGRFKCMVWGSGLFFRSGCR